MNNECKIISDLLPLYAVDMVCEETAEFIKNHLSECEDCKNDFEAFKNGDDLKEIFKEEPTKPAEDIKPFKKIMKKNEYAGSQYFLLVDYILYFLWFSFNG